MRKKTVTKKKKATAAPTTLIAKVYALVKNCNFPTQHSITKDAELVTLYPKNGFAEKIVVSKTRFDVAESRIELHRIKEGDKDVSLDFVSDNGVRTEMSAFHIIKAELKRYC